VESNRYRTGPDDNHSPGRQKESHARPKCGFFSLLSVRWFFFSIRHHSPPSVCAACTTSITDRLQTGIGPEAVCLIAYIRVHTLSHSLTLTHTYIYIYIQYIIYTGRLAARTVSSPPSSSSSSPSTAETRINATGARGLAIIVADDDDDCNTAAFVYRILNERRRRRRQFLENRSALVTDLH